MGLLLHLLLIWVFIGDQPTWVVGECLNFFKLKETFMPSMPSRAQASKLG
jgi:hypothetical protein